MISLWPIAISRVAQRHWSCLRYLLRQYVDVPSNRLSTLWDQSSLIGIATFQLSCVFVGSYPITWQTLFTLQRPLNNGNPISFSFNNNFRPVHHRRRRGRKIKRNPNKNISCDDRTLINYSDRLNFTQSTEERKKKDRITNKTKQKWNEEKYILT